MSAENLTDANGVESGKQFSAFLLNLAERIESGEVEVQNDRVSAYVDAVGRWLESQNDKPSAYHNGDGQGQGQGVPWPLVARIFESGLYYE